MQKDERKTDVNEKDNEMALRIVAFVPWIENTAVKRRACAERKIRFDRPRVNFPLEILKENTTSNRSHVNNAKKIETSIEWIILNRYIPLTIANDFSFLYQKSRILSEALC